MRTFETFPADTKCVICGKNDNKPCALLPIAGTQDGMNCQATPVHVDCMNDLPLAYSEKHQMIFAYIGNTPVFEGFENG